MSSPATSPAAEKAAETQFHRDVLNELIEIGAEMARRVNARDMAQTGDADFTAPLERTARTVRRCIALVRVLDEPARNLPAAAGLGAVRGQVRCAVEASIRCAADPSEHAELREALLDRMERPEFDDAIGSHPVEDVIGEICDDFGLTAGALENPGAAAEAYAQALRDRYRRRALAAVPLAKMPDADLTFLSARTQWPWIATPGQDRDDDASGGHP